MEKLKNFLKRIKIYIYKLLKKEPILLIGDNNEIQAELINESVKIEDKQNDKKEFFQLYKNVKEKNTVDNLMITDLLKIMSMMQQEIEIYDKKIKKSEMEVLNQDTEIKMLKKENEKMNQILSS